MNAEIISVGDELLIGQTVNTNASYIGEQCTLAGITVRRITTIGDNRSAMKEAFTSAWQTADAVIVTGGLGPTHDDITRDCVVEFFDTELEFSEEVYADIEEIFRKSKRELSKLNRDQALVPKDAEYIRNTKGTAPGMHFMRDGKHFFVTPGVPSEMKAMVRESIIPELRKEIRSAKAIKVLMSTGIPESLLAQKLEGVEEHFEEAGLAYLPSLTGVRMRLSAEADTREDAEKKLNRLQEFIYERAGEFIYGEDEVSLEERIGELLRERGETLAVAESCTGGLIGSKITDIPGSSAYFERGVVTYSDASKQSLLGVAEATLIAHGAVSREVAIEMARGVRKNAGTSYGISTTGIAGPDGGTDEKPVGLVWIGISSDRGDRAVSFHFGNDRHRTKVRASQAALELLRRDILGLPIKNQREQSNT